MMLAVSAERRPTGIAANSRAFRGCLSADRLSNLDNDDAAISRLTCGLRHGRRGKSSYIQIFNR